MAVVAQYIEQQLYLHGFADLTPLLKSWVNASRVVSTGMQ
jgi:hypothetical protein